MANIMICSTGKTTELYIDSNRVVQGVERVSFAASAGGRAKMELSLDVDAFEIEPNYPVEGWKNCFTKFMKKAK